MLAAPGLARSQVVLLMVLLWQLIFYEAISTCTESKAAFGTLESLVCQKPP
jgi:hypothetical protein